MARLSTNDFQDSKRGVTLVELIFVMVIFTIIISIVLGTSQAARQKSRNVLAKSEINNLALAIEAFKTYYGDYPRLSAYPLGNDKQAQLLAAKELFDLLTGVKIMQLTSREITLLQAPVGKVPRFIEASSLTTDDPEHPTYFLDPWGNPYNYYYKTHNIQQDSNWKFTGFILLSRGIDESIEEGGRASSGGAISSRNGC